MLVCIVGTGRNGSTLLSRLLDGIPGAYVHPVETNFLAAFNDLARYGRVRLYTAQNASTAPLRHLDRQVPTSVLLEVYGPHMDAIRNEYLAELTDPIALGPDPRQVLACRESYDAVTFVPAFLKAMADWLTSGISPNPVILMFKTIETPYVAEYEALFPDVKFIHIIRNPLDVWSSQKRTLAKKQCPSWYLGGDNLRTLLDRRWVPHAEAILSRQKSARHAVIRYEDLTVDPQKVICTACNRLGVPCPTAPDRQTVLGGRAVRKLPKNSSGSDADTPVEVVADLQRRLGYIGVATPREIGFIRLATKATAGCLGYTLDAATLHRTKLWLQWLVPDRGEFTHAGGPFGILRAGVAAVARRCYIWRTIISPPR